MTRSLRIEYAGAGPKGVKARHTGMENEKISCDRSLNLKNMDRSLAF